MRELRAWTVPAGVLGTIAESGDVVCTGPLMGDNVRGPAQADAVREPATYEGLDLAVRAAGPDSVNDLPKLGLGGNSGAISLRRHAEVAGRRVRDYRTGWKAARRALLTAGASGVTLGAVSAAVAIRGSIRCRRVR